MYLYIPINPEPWKVGPLGIGRKGGKVYPYIGPDEQLKSFQLAVKEELDGWGAKHDMIDGPVWLEFYFWRRQDTYESAGGRKVTKHVLDATNMQKATEDALQGIFFDNDRNVKHVRSTVVDSGTDVIPGIGIEIRGVTDEDLRKEVPRNILLAKVSADSRTATQSDNTWPPKRT